MEATPRTSPSGNTTALEDQVRDSSRPGSSLVDSLTETWFDVSELVLHRLQAEVESALSERVSCNDRLKLLIDQVSRITDLEAQFTTLIWLHFELALPPFTHPLPPSFPADLLPDALNSAASGPSSQYHQTVTDIFTANPYRLENEELDEAVELKATENLEPELGLIHFINELVDIVCLSVTTPTY